MVRIAKCVLSSYRNDIAYGQYDALSGFTDKLIVRGRAGFSTLQVDDATGQEGSDQ